MNESSNISFKQDKIVLYKLFIDTCQFVLLALNHLPPQPYLPSSQTQVLKKLGKGRFVQKLTPRLTSSHKMKQIFPLRSLRTHLVSKGLLHIKKKYALN